MLLSWSKLMPKPELPEEIRKQVLWFSKYNIRPDGHSLCYKALVSRGLLYFRDMINNGAIMGRNDLLNKGYNELEIWYYNNVWNCLPREWRSIDFGITEYNQKNNKGLLSESNIKKYIQEVDNLWFRETCIREVFRRKIQCWFIEMVRYLCSSLPVYNWK